MVVDIDEARIDAIFRGIDSDHEPGAAVGISYQGEPVYRKGFGLATQGRRPLTLSPSTRMRIYSVTKHFTCLAYLLLCEEGKAALGDPVNRYISSVVSPQVTMSHLMTNTSGLWDITDIRWSLGGGSGLLELADVPVWYQRFEGRNFAPGGGWCYNNGGFQLLSLAIQEISGRPLDEFLKERIFDRVGMCDTSLQPADTDCTGNSAATHVSGNAGKYERAHLPGELSGEGGIVSTVDDMLRWLLQMNKPAVGTADSWAALKRPTTLHAGKSFGYGLGLTVGNRRGVEMIGHSGGGLGASAQVIKLPAVGLDVVVLANREGVNAPELAHRIIDACVPALAGGRRTETGAVAVGLFRSVTSGRVIRLYGEGGDQKVSINGSIGYRFAHDEEGILKSGPESMPCTCCIRILDSERNPSSIELDEGRGAERFDVIRAPANPSLSSISGLYRSDSVGTGITIEQDGNSAVLEAMGCFGAARYSLRHFNGNLWSFEPLLSYLPWRGILSFDSTVEGFSWMTERTWDLRFCREARGSSDSGKN